MKITRVRVMAMSDPVPPERRHRTDLGTKVKSDSAIIFVETNAGLTGMGAALGNPAVLQAVVEHELGPQIEGEAMASPNCHILEVSQGYMPMIWELFNEPFDIRDDGMVVAPERPGLGFSMQPEAMERFKYLPGPEYEW